MRASRFLFVINIHLVLLFLAVPARSETIEIKFSHPGPANSPVGQGAEIFKKLAEERLEGSVEVKVYPNSQLGNYQDVMDGLQSGRIEMAVLPLTAVERLSPRLLIFEMPFLFEDLGAVTRFQHSPAGKSLLDAAANQGYKGLSFWHYGMKQLSANKPIRVPADAKGLKFRTSGSDAATALYKAIGAIPQPLPLMEVYAALEKGVIDGQENAWSTIYRFGLYELQKYISATNHGYLGYLLAISLKLWESFPAHLQMEIEAISQEMTPQANKLAVEDTNLAVKKIVEFGDTTVLNLTGEEILSWREAVAPVWYNYKEKIGSEIMDVAVRYATGGGGDPCPLGQCKCRDRTCNEGCCY